MRRKLVAGNWKMHGSKAANAALLAELRSGEADLRCDVVLCPPFPFLSQVEQALHSSVIALGAQNLSEHALGAYTGEVSASMLLDCGCRYVLIGHSERRSLFAESDDVVAAKFVAAQAAGLIPVLCVGETLAERESGQTDSVVARQLQVVLDRAGVQSLNNAVLAYEPVWAIGTGKTASPQQAQAVHAAMRSQVSGGDPSVAAALRILYGGSVKPANAQELFDQPDIDGGLIGGASLVAEDFLAICRAAN